MVARLCQRDGEVHRDRRLPHAALARGDTDDARLGVGTRKAGIAAAAARDRARRGRAHASPRRAVAVAVAVAEHAGAQAVAQPGPLLVAHHDELELHLLDPGHGEGGPVDLLGQLVGAGPGRHGQGHLNEHPATAGPHGAEQAEVTEREAELRVLDRVQRSLDL